MGTGAVLSARDLSFGYGRRQVFERITLSVQAGEILGILGPNGAGKTTLIKCLVGLLIPHIGEIFLNDNRVTGFPLWRRARKGMAYLSQQASLLPDLTVLENVEIGCRTSGARHLAEAALAQIGLSSYRDEHPTALSGGQCRLVELARLFVSEAKLLILDEPFAMLDPKNRHDVARYIKYFQAQGRTVIITDHDVLRTLKLADRSIVIVNGAICCEGNAAKDLARSLCSGALSR